MKEIGKYERTRGKCINCGKRRLVTRCPCPICKRGYGHMIMCAECEYEEMSCWYDRKKASYLRNYDFKTRMMSAGTT